MSDDGPNDQEDKVTDEPRITLDRTNLKRLAGVLRETPRDWEDLIPADMVVAVKLGWDMAVQSIDKLADASPDLYGDHGWPAMMQDDA